ncbi:MAG: hypothetical protein Q9204_002672 [Flavoplaca sp. TL-2023a]
MVINETHRHHSTLSIGLPRLVPPGTVITLHSTPIPPSTTLSIPTYTLHHSPKIWGPTASEFDPSRWSPSLITEGQKAAFMPFGVGPRSCIGRNVAEMELAMVVAGLVRGFEFELRQEGVETREGFLRKMGGCRVGVRRRRCRRDGR